LTRHLYIHIPFCHHICPYCAFYKHRPGSLANAAFINAILAEAQIRARETDISLKTIYLGGGTPSALSAAHLTTLCEGLREIFDLSEVVEWTMECNPATFDLKKARLFRDLGVTRPSLGVQSFHQKTLKTLGRDHSADAASEAFQTLREAGFSNLSLDLMFSIPGQKPSDWEYDLATAVALSPEHISCYNLTYEDDTEFMQRHQTGELDACEDRDATAFYRAIEFLESHGFQHYEISNYARPGFQSIHNQAYWTGQNYLGLGPSAVTTIDDIRWKSLADTAAYTRAMLDGAEIKTEIETLSAEDKRIEAIALQLRTACGLPDSYIVELSAVDGLTQQGLLIKRNDRYCLTHEGKALADPIAASLI
jgi:oxygen-independent coproporphyrinogen III oxidase